MIQRNAIVHGLCPDVEVILLGEEEGLRVPKTWVNIIPRGA